MQAGVEGLLRDKTRLSRIAPLGAAVFERVVTLMLTEPPGRAPTAPQPPWAQPAWSASARALAANFASNTPMRRSSSAHSARMSATIGRVAASATASASRSSFFRAFTYGRTYSGGISRS